MDVMIHLRMTILTNVARRSFGGARKGTSMGEKQWLERQFAWNERLGISVPALGQDWETMTPRQQMIVLERWELVRGRIPDRIMRLEEKIRIRQDALSLEEDFASSCRLNGDIAELASRINDLHIWFRTQQDLEDETKRHA